MTQQFDITDNEKFELEFVSTAELALLAKNAKQEIDHIAEKMRLYGSSHEEFGNWKREKHLKMRRRNYILSRIKSRQLQLL